jgi:osmoprotectant transport system ATP-binding protein
LRCQEVDVITFEAVTKRYPDGTVAVHNLSLRMPHGRITVLVGPSGCGKTTSLRMINRMVEPTGGTVWLDDVDVRTVDPPTLRRGIGYVIQHAGLLPHRTIIDNIATVPYLLGWDKRKARARAMELLDLLGLPAAAARRYPYQLSGGQQQRVGVARALAADPPVILMDEPFSAVDPVVRKSLQDELLRLQGELSKTIVFVTHDIDEAIKLGDQIAILRQGGELAQFDRPERLLAEPRDAFVEGFIGVDRGIRRLSFFPASELELRTDTTIPLGATAEEARRVAEAAGEPWLLVVDEDRRPVGWLLPDTLQPGTAAGDAGQASQAGQANLAPYGHPFRPQTDSLRAALDSAVLSPAGRAVGVDDAGRTIGTISQAEIGEVARSQAGARTQGQPAPTDEASQESRHEAPA